MVHSPDPDDDESSEQQDDFTLNGIDYTTTNESSSTFINFLRFLSLQFPQLFGVLFKAFGFTPVLTLCISYFFVKGMAFTAFQLIVLPFLKDGLGVDDGATYQRITTITSLAWPTVTLMGVLSDGVPIFGYRKRYYLTGAAVLGSCLLCGIFFLKPNSSSSEKNPPIFLAAFFMFVINFCFATIDLLCEAAYSRFYSLKPKAGAALISLVWGLTMISGVPGAFVVGPLADDHKSFLAMAVIGVLVSVTIVPFYENWLGEKPMMIVKDIDDDESEQDHSKKAKTMMVVEKDLKIHEKIIEEEEKTIHVVHDADESFTKADASNLRLQSLAMGIICPLTACAAFALEMMYDVDNDNGTINSTVLLSASSQQKLHRDKAFRKLMVPLLCACLLLYLAFRWLPSKIFKALTFMMLKEVLYVNLAGAEDFYFVADSKCVPNGPQFSYTFYQTTVTIFGSVFGAVGSLLFHKYFAKQNFQRLFYMTTILRIVASLFDIGIIERWNIKYLGLDDRAAYVFGDAIIWPVTATLDLMPAVMLMAQLCPKGNEATMNAVLASFTNYGQGISGFLGAYMTDVFGIRTKMMNHHIINNNASSTEDDVHSVCDFRNLSWLVFVGHAIMPAITLLLISILVPNAKADFDHRHQNDNENDDDGGEQEGSVVE